MSIDKHMTIDNVLCFVIVSYFKTNQASKPASPSAQGASCMTKTPSLCSDTIHQEILELEMTAAATSDCSQIRERQGRRGHITNLNDADLIGLHKHLAKLGVNVKFPFLGN